MQQTYAELNRAGNLAEVREITFLQESFVKITNLRTIIGTITYSMSDINSVNVTKRAKSYKSLWLVPAGLFFILWSILDQTRQFFEFFNLGMLLIIVGIVLLSFSKPTYAVQIGSVAGKSSILRSIDLASIQRIVDAMNKAIQHRG